MSKLQLKNITLVGCTCRDYVETLLALEHCANLCDFNNIVYFSDLDPFDFIYGLKLNIPNLTYVYVESFMTYDRVCIWFMTSYFKYQHLFSDFTLNIHHDGYIIRPNAWTNEFLEYDFVGACQKWEVPMVMNNGFCLYSKQFIKAMEKLNLPATSEACHPSDMILLKNHEKMNVKIAPVTLGHQFSSEGFRWDNNGSFGFHGLYNLVGADIKFPDICVPKHHKYYLTSNIPHRYSPI